MTGRERAKKFSLAVDPCLPQSKRPALRLHYLPQNNVTRLLRDKAPAATECDLFVLSKASSFVRVENDHGAESLEILCSFCAPGW